MLHCFLQSFCNRTHIFHQVNLHTLWHAYAVLARQSPMLAMYSSAVQWGCLYTGIMRGMYFLSLHAHCSIYRHLFRAVHTHKYPLRTRKESLRKCGHSKVAVFTTPLGISYNFICSLSPCVSPGSTLHITERAVLLAIIEQ